MESHQEKPNCQEAEGWINSIKAWARKLKRKILILYLVYKKKDTPIYAKVIIALVLAYALSPIDIIPDFIPVLGYLDDLLLLPLGIALAIRLVPADILEACRVEAASLLTHKLPHNWTAGIVIIGLWTTLVVVLIIKYL